MPGSRRFASRSLANSTCLNPETLEIQIRPARPTVDQLTNTNGVSLRMWNLSTHSKGVKQLDENVLIDCRVQRKSSLLLRSVKRSNLIPVGKKKLVPTSKVHR